MEPYDPGRQLCCKNYNYLKKVIFLYVLLHSHSGLMWRLKLHTVTSTSLLISPLSSFFNPSSSPSSLLPLPPSTSPSPSFSFPSSQSPPPLLSSFVPPGPSGQIRASDHGRVVARIIQLRFSFPTKPVSYTLYRCKCCLKYLTQLV